jgi:hypothetical protein
MGNPYHDPRWQKFRLERLEMAKWSCDNCGDSKSKLNIHHCFYVAGRSPWDYLKKSTMVLCDECHECEHDFTDSDRPEIGNSQIFERWEYSAAITIQDEISLRREITKGRKEKSDVR